MVKPQIQIMLWAAILAATATPTLANQIDRVQFEQLRHGQLVDQPIEGLSITTLDDDATRSDARAFDTTARGTGLPDLEGFNGQDRPWERGNLDPQTDTGIVLTVEPHDDSAPATEPAADADTLADCAPLRISFNQRVDSFAMDVVNVVQPHTALMRFFRGEVELAAVRLSEMLDPDSRFYDNTLDFGPRSINRLQEITADALDTDAFDRIEVTLIGAAIDNVVYRTSSPQTFNIDTKLPANNYAGGFEGAPLDAPQTPPLSNVERLVVLNSGFVGGGDGAGGNHDPFDPPTFPDDPSVPRPIATPNPTAAAAGLVLLAALSSRVFRTRRRRNW